MSLGHGGFPIGGAGCKEIVSFPTRSRFFRLPFSAGAHWPVRRTGLKWWGRRRRRRGGQKNTVHWEPVQLEDDRTDARG